jgi:glycosyltransferase involved in cell wall biosynthesis
MQQRLPLVSVIITSYNRASLIVKTIESALAQDYPNLEIIISDNCSTDDSDAVIRKYTGDPRIRYFRNAENIGMMPNFIKATYELSRGEYLTYVSSDDYLTDPTFVSECIKIVNKHDDVLLVFGKLLGQNTENGILWKMPEDPFFAQEIWDGMDVLYKSAESYLLSFGGCLMKRTAMDEVQSLYCPYFTGDIDSNYKIMVNGKVGFVNKFCYLHLGHAGNHGFPVDAQKIIESLQCYESIHDYALAKKPGDKEKLNNWKRHFLFFTINWAFYHLRSKSETEFKKFKEGLKNAYPKEYKEYMSGPRYRRFVLSTTFKKYIPSSLIKLARKMKI